MSDPAVLRTSADDCRAAAVRIDQQAQELASSFGILQRRHPVDAVWRGPEADNYRAVLADASARVREAVQDAHDYVAALRRRAGDLEIQAAEAERRQHRAP